jgi:hypothetical protein
LEGREREKGSDDQIIEEETTDVIVSVVLQKVDAVVEATTYFYIPCVDYLVLRVLLVVVSQSCAHSGKS